MTDPAPDLDLYRRTVQHFTDLVDAVAPDQWSAPTPDEGWDVSDLVDHVVDRDRMLAATVGGRNPDELDGIADPTELPAAWRDRVSWWHARLADPALAEQRWQTPFGTKTFAEAAVSFTVSELTVHAWDLARAIGADETLDPEAVSTSFQEFRTNESNLRRPGVMAAAVEVTGDADEQTRFLAFTGRRP